MRLLCLFLCIASFGAFAAPARTVYMDTNSVCKVRTSLGHSTLLQFESRPTSIVAGDQDAFKIEYVGQNISIKPLMALAKTNLFVLLPNRTYSFELTCTGFDFDYAIAVRDSLPKTPKEPVQNQIRLTPVNVTASSGKNLLKVTSVGYPPSGKALLIRLKVDTATEVPWSEIQVEFSQEKKPVPFAELHFDQPPATRGNSFTATAVVRRSSLDLKTPLVVETRLGTEKPLRVSIPTSALKEKH